MPATTTDTLIAAGRVMAADDPDKDLLNFATDAREIASSIRNVAGGLDYAYDLDCGEDDTIHALGTAKRTLQQSLVHLATLIGEIEMQMLLTERLRFARGEG